MKGGRAHKPVPHWNLPGWHLNSAASERNDKKRKVERKENNEQTNVMKKEHMMTE